MKTIVALVAACVVVSLTQADLNLTEDQKNKLAGHHQACAGTEAYLGILLEGNLPDEKPFKNYLLCISQRIGFQNKSGEVQKDVIISRLRNSIADPTKAEEYLEKCLVEGDPADVVFKVISCLQETTPKFSIV